MGLWSHRPPELRNNAATRWIRPTLTRRGKRWRSTCRRRRRTRPEMRFHRLAQLGPAGRAAARHRPRLRVRRQGGRLARVSLRAGLRALGAERDPARRAPPDTPRAVVDLPARGAAVPLPRAIAGAPIARVAIQYVANVAEAVLGAWAHARILSRPAPLRSPAYRGRTHTCSPASSRRSSPACFMVAAFALAGHSGGVLAHDRRPHDHEHVRDRRPRAAHRARRRRTSGRPPAGVARGASWKPPCSRSRLRQCARWSSPPRRETQPSGAWLFAPLPLLAWATIRFRVPGACSAALLVGAISTWGVLNGHGPFDVANPIENALSLVAFHVVICVTFVFCAALLEEWRHAGRALAASEGLHAAVLGSVHDQIAVLDSAGRIIEVNESWRRAVQLAHPARFDRVLANQSYLDACAHAAESGQHAAREHLAALCDVLDGRETRRHFEYLEPAGMEQAWIEVSIEKLRRPEGGAVVTRTDISARKRAEHEARMQQQQLTHLGRAAVLGQLSGAFAHELNQPLTSILGNAEAALRMIASGNADPDEIEEILCDIVHDDVRAVPGDRPPPGPARAGRHSAAAGGPQCHGRRGARPRQERTDHPSCPCRRPRSTTCARGHGGPGPDAADRAESPHECLRGHERHAGRGSQGRAATASCRRNLASRSR